MMITVVGGHEDFLLLGHLENKNLCKNLCSGISEGRKIEMYYSSRVSRFLFAPLQLLLDDRNPVEIDDDLC
jgi:hypothetical protein